MMEDSKNSTWCTKASPNQIHTLVFEEKLGANSIQLPPSALLELMWNLGPPVSWQDTKGPLAGCGQAVSGL